jgi:hypothetical protein
VGLQLAFVHQLPQQQAYSNVQHPSYQPNLPQQFPSEFSVFRFHGKPHTSAAAAIAAIDLPRTKPLSKAFR